MKIVVLMKQVPDTWGERKLDSVTGWVERSGDNVIDEINERALEVALSYKDTDKSAEVVVMTMAPDNVSESIKKALAMGCDSAVHITDAALAGADAAYTAAVLSAALKELGPDLVIAGNESTDGRGGIVPSMIAEHLDVAHLGMLGNISITNASVAGIRLLEDGTQEVHAALPAVISVNESNPDARFPSFKGIMGAKKKPVSTKSVAELSLSKPKGSTSILSATARPARTAGTKITDDGTAGEQLAEFLVSNRLI
ncbi:electron transfer flavoprotein subunit beta/FixA family protein [Aurantimicrobium minutum]|uniref:Electron transfer flavoprotein subunit beta n=1 Tax=Aurantimicrobium minutum TaxID=708131 RepID=A0A173LYY5_9MICO|nr:electron transfer flavoprotein subunit beta/FixA family protein [Aurantimicrobium minutum]BAV00111.1 electron transfer flavoprotein [Aurantimicrobium minutum]